MTAGLSGFLRTVRLPVLRGGADLLLQVQRVTAGVPNGVVLASQSIPSATLPPGDHFKDLSFSAPAFLRRGEQFAIVLTTAGSCGIFPGPVGDSYLSGNLYFDASYNPLAGYVSATFLTPGSTCRSKRWLKLSFRKSPSLGISTATAKAKS